MINHGRISIPKMILSLSEAMDFVRPEIAGHQHRVAYIAMKLAERMGCAGKDLSNIFLAATLHDIGMIRTDRRIRAIRDNDMTLVGWHPRVGYELLNDIDILSPAASIILLHHTPWSGSRGLERKETVSVLGSQVILLGDQVEIAIDRNSNILDQSSRIIDRFGKRNNNKIHPDCLEVFHDVTSSEAFWLDCVSNRVQSFLLQAAGDFQVEVSSTAILDISEIFARVVDSMNPWTSTHSAGVTATAVALSRLLRFSAREQLYMKVAGLLHDLGKLSVPTRILDKPSKLSGEEWATVKGHSYHTFRLLEEIGFPRQIVEWAAFHHERIDGKGYPFHHGGDDLTLGSRIMAVADIFTALTENRPYRKADPGGEAVTRLFRLVEDGALDREVTTILADNHDFIDDCRRDAQAAYAERQESISRTLFEETTSEEVADVDQVPCK